MISYMRILNNMDIIISLVVLVYSAILHEVSHGYVADRFGDPTARLQGRLTLDPRPHIDTFSSILLPILLLMSGSPILIGAAKPVPVDPFNLRDGRKDMALVALSGPLTNILLAVAASLLIRLLFSTPASHVVSPFFFSLLYPILSTIMNINLLLAIFNLLPIPPLDGSKVFALLLPEKEASAYLSMGSIGFFILIFLLLFPIGGFSLSHFIYTLLSSTQQFLLP